MSDEKEVKKKGCVSVNKHYFLTNSEGVKIQIDAKCELGDGHSGDHRALLKTGLKNREGLPEEKNSFWNSAAESPL